MNYEAASIIFFDFFVIFVTLCEVGSKFAENLARPAVGTEQAASGRSYGLGVRGSHNTYLRYYQSLMYIGLPTSDTLHKKPWRIGSGRRSSLSRYLRTTPSLP